MVMSAPSSTQLVGRGRPTQATPFMRPSLASTRPGGPRFGTPMAGQGYDPRANAMARLQALTQYLGRTPGQALGGGMGAPGLVDDSSTQFRGGMTGLITDGNPNPMMAGRLPTAVPMGPVNPMAGQMGSMTARQRLMQLIASRLLG